MQTLQLELTAMPDEQVIACTTAAEFIDALRPDHERWVSPTQKWIFRGQAELWPLLPMALRPGVTGDRGVFVSDADPPDLAALPQWLEYRLLRAFVEAAEEHGITLPGDHAKARESGTSLLAWLEGNRPRSRDGGGPFAWPGDPIAPILGLAQHHGVPTRLLAWSRNSFIAAFFAVREAAEAQHRSHSDDPQRRDLVVWALNVHGITSPRAPLVRVGDRDGRLRLVEVPAGLSASLGTQRGIFTLLREMVPVGDPLERLVPTEQLRRVTLPWHEAPKALVRLHLYRVDGGNMWPGAEGAAMRVREQLWMRREI